MKKSLITLFIVLLIVLNGCTYINKLKDINFVKQPIINTTINNTINETNQTANETVQIQAISLNSDKTNIIITYPNSLLIYDEDKFYIVDIPKENPKVVTYLNRFSVNQTEFAMVTIDNEEHNGGIRYITNKATPKSIYDNGINDQTRQDYINRLNRYNSYWGRENTTYHILMEDTKVDNFKFFIPYANGLSQIKEQNSIVVFFKDTLLYMSDCYGDCEKKIPPVYADYLLLANDGKCPTNSIDFILDTGASYVIGNEVCQELIEELDFIGIKYIALNGKTMQIILGGDENEKDEIQYE